jgi:F0F1-type ATP synthase membrane subunit a
MMDGLQQTRYLIVVSVLASCLAVTSCALCNALTGMVRLSVGLGIVVWLAVHAYGIKAAP